MVELVLHAACIRVSRSVHLCFVLADPGYLLAGGAGHGWKRAGERQLRVKFMTIDDSEGWVLGKLGVGMEVRATKYCYYTNWTGTGALLVPSERLRA